MNRRDGPWRMCLRLGLGIALGCLAAAPAADAATDFSPTVNFIAEHCLDCHNAADATAGLNLESFPSDAARAGAIDGDTADWDTAPWEAIVRRLRARQMPPADHPQPAEAEIQQALAQLENALDAFATANPQPGRTDALRRLTRTEYGNAVRDLLGVEIAVEELLPADPPSHGFDNVTVGELSPTLLSRYITAAEKISLLAVGGPLSAPQGVTIRIAPDRTQQSHLAGLPLGTRGGALLRHHFPRSGEYEIQLRLARDRDEKVEGLDRSCQIDVLIDNAPRHRFTVEPPADQQDHTSVDAHLKTRLQISAGTHALGVTFPRHSDSLLEIKRQPFDASFNLHRHPRQEPAILQISIVGPLSAASPAHSDQPLAAPEQPRIDQDPEVFLARLMRRAYRRPITAEDLQTPLRFFHAEKTTAGFDTAMQAAVASILVNPHFLFRVEQPPSGVAPETAYTISDLELASRLSFFLWSSVPDDELLDLAEAGQLSEPQRLRRQVQRMIRDERSRSLVDNFASQWLYLRNLDSITPDLREFPDFDQNLRTSFRQETERLFADVLRRDLSVLRLIDSPQTFLNERLAQHYGIPHVRGSHFRPVALTGEHPRGGLLRHGSILMLTSYATRTSPTVRGNWILENFLGTPAPPPPPNIPALPEKSASTAVSIRERLAQHREDPSCASCHDRMDPIGFSLEHFDAVGRWRVLQADAEIDARGRMPDGTEIEGVDELEDALLARPELFVTALTEKLMTFALGRGITPSDGPAIRKIVRQAASDDNNNQNYPLSLLLEGVVFSQPFLMRTSP